MKHWAFDIYWFEYLHKHIVHVPCHWLFICWLCWNCLLCSTVSQSTPSGDAQLLFLVRLLVLLQHYFPIWMSGRCYLSLWIKPVTLVGQFNVLFLWVTWKCYDPFPRFYTCLKVGNGVCRQYAPLVFRGHRWRLVYVY